MKPLAHCIDRGRVRARAGYLADFVAMETQAVLDLMKHSADTVIRPRFRELSESDIHEKAPGDLVTVADRESEKVMIEVLAQEYPDALLVGEEATAADPTILERIKTAEHAWTIDPIDGTRNFVNGDPDYAVMVGELRNGKAVRGWIWQPEHEVAHIAELGSGTYRNGVKVERSAPTDMAALRGATSTKLAGAGDLGIPTPQSSSGCAGVDYAWILDDRIDWTAFRHDWPWDHVPGLLMIEEAGGKTGRPTGAPYDPRVREYWIMAAASPEAFDAVAHAAQQTIARIAADR